MALVKPLAGAVDLYFARLTVSWTPVEICDRQYDQ